MSHELRTPLNAILGFGRNLARAQDLKPEHQSEIDIIRRSGDHLLEMIDEILSLSRIEAGRVELQQAPFDLVRTLEDIAGNDHGAGGRPKDCVLILSLTPRCRVSCGEMWARYARCLLTCWATRSSSPNRGMSSLRACTKPLDNDPARVLLQLAVEDSGLGIPEEQLPTIFDSFVQGNHTGDAAEGTGLGSGDLPVAGRRDGRPDRCDEQARRRAPCLR